MIFGNPPLVLAVVVLLYAPPDVSHTQHTMLNGTRRARLSFHMTPVSTIHNAQSFVVASFPLPLPSTPPRGSIFFGGGDLAIKTPSFSCMYDFPGGGTWGLGFLGEKSSISIRKLD